MKKTRKVISAAVALGALATFSVAEAGMITEWDQSNVVPRTPTNITNPGFVFDQYNYIEPGYLTDPNTGAVSTDGFMPSGWAKYSVGSGAILNAAGTVVGAMTWKERDTQGPGLSIVNGDDQTGDNCIMSAGWNPDSTVVLDANGIDITEMSDWWGIDKKQCSDPFQSSKRFKSVSYMLDTPVDLTFNVANNGQTEEYRLLMKYGNQTGARVTGFTMQLGFLDAGGNFTEAGPSSGLSFCSRNGGNYDYTVPVTSDIMKQGELDALQAHGLFGAPDQHHTSYGYFNPYVRATFLMTANQTHIVASDMSAVHTDLFGEWLPSSNLKGGLYFDADNIIYTDNILMASCPGNFSEEAGTTGVANADCDEACAANLGCDAPWVTYRESVNITLNADGTWNIPAVVGTDIRQPIELTAAELDAIKANPAWSAADIDDLANVNINAFLNVSDLPQGNFTLRVTPTFDATTATTEPGTAGPADFDITINAPNTVTP
ncbi:MAG: choice-of-anchor F family protein [Proteobacteria bacterium]|nr:choice-of-anchor F family protein [Pseudomonadota bacterium]MBU4295046.1 choice-of-anchor F family protein [Pseudomonadota bacterium]MCG2746602.1 choice-of-anchor F family protein [Desulfobulbaceae bacterium]